MSRLSPKTKLREKIRLVTQVCGLAGSLTFLPYQYDRHECRSIADA